MLIPSVAANSWIITGTRIAVGRNTFVRHAALALFGHVRSIRGKQHQPLLPSRVASLASER